MILKKTERISTLLQLTDILLNDNQSLRETITRLEKKGKYNNEL